MITKKRGTRGRPRGTTEQGETSRQNLYAAAVALLAERGYEGTTLREVAARAGVSPALLYRYFPGKDAVVLALYDELSATYAKRAGRMRPGRWAERFLFALRASLAVLRPYRGTLVALTPVLVGDVEQGLFSPRTRFSRRRVEAAFQEAVAGASDHPGSEVEALGRVLYVAHLLVILWWLLDRSPRQRATDALLKWLESALPLAGLALGLERGRAWLRTADALCRDALLDRVAEGPAGEGRRRRGSGAPHLER